MKEDALFEAALEIDNAEKRQAFLDKGCKEAPALRARLEALLRAHEQPDSFFDAPPGELVAMALASVKDELVGATIGLYTLREQIGEGGMGVVYVAEQKQPVRRKVALKIIKAGMDSNQVILRFEAERQTLALMDHPNIAKIIDAGSTDAGRPYFVMELIRGIPITEYCDQTTMPMRQRLELFISVCRAVQHAHLKGIIHRDLKPSNVLVTEIDGECVPKVIDFGVAKATGQQMSEQTIIYTHFSQMIGTPIYMSPEQAGISGVDIDTRSDVYSLGVLLYELLSGKTPFDSETLRQAGFDEMRRIMREEEPPRPSVQLSTLEAADSSTISACRGLDPRRLQQIVHGELDWIVMKAVEKDRNRRYESASAFSVDIERYLANEPVIACPPSAAYRLRKFATRHKAVFLTSTLVAVALVLGTIVSLWQAQEANEAQRFAEEQRDLAQRNEAFGEQLVYAADVRLAAQAWGSGDVGHYSSLLDRHALSKTGKDLRGFEWRYLRQLGAASSHTIAEVAVGVCSVRHSPNGKFLAAGRCDGKIHIWDGRSNRQLAVLSGHVELVRGLDFSADSKRLASIGYGGVIRIWDLETFSEIQTIKAFKNAHGYRVCFALGGQAVIAIAEKSPTTIWDIESGKLLDSFGNNGRGFWGLTVSPDGQSCVVVEGPLDVRIWDLNPRKLVASLDFPIYHESPKCCRYSPDGAFIAVGTDENMVRVYDARTGEIVASFAGHEDEIWDVAFHPSDEILASSDLGGVIRTWHLDDKVGASDTASSHVWPAAFRAHPSRAWSIDFSPDGKRLVSASRDRTIRAWAGHTQSRRELNVSNSVASDFSPSSDELFIIRQHAITRWNKEANAVQPFGSRLQDKGTSLAVSPAGARIATGHASGCIRIWNRKTEKIKKLLLGHEARVDRITFSPDGKLLVSTSRDGTASLWDVDAEEQHCVFETPTRCFDATFSPDGKEIAIASEDHVMLYDTSSGELRHRLQGHLSSATCVSFSPDGRWLATGSRDRTVRIWDVHSGKTRHVIFAHHGEIYALDFSPDGRTIASGDEMGVLAFSHVETGRFLYDITAAEGKIACLRFSPDGETLAATCDGKQVVLFQAARLAAFDEQAAFGQPAGRQPLLVDTRSENEDSGSGVRVKPLRN